MKNSIIIALFLSIISCATVAMDLVEQRQRHIDTDGINQLLVNIATLDYDATHAFLHHLIGHRLIDQEHLGAASEFARFMNHNYQTRLSFIPHWYDNDDLVHGLILLGLSAHCFSTIFFDHHIQSPPEIIAHSCAGGIAFASALICFYKADHIRERNAQQANRILNLIERHRG